MTEQEVKQTRNAVEATGIDVRDEALWVSQENYKDALEQEILRRIEIMEAPGYQRVPRFNKPDLVFAVVLACLMIVLILWGGTF